MNLTPSQKGSFLAGVGLWVLIWASVWKADDIAEAMRIQRWFNSARCIRWIGRHKSTSLLGTELVNYGTHGASETLLTTERELSLSREKVQLLGLDHPLVSAYLRKFRELSPEDVGIRVQAPDGTEGVLAAWAVEARGDKGQLKRMIVTLGIDGEGRRHVAWERQPERM